jgi:hypothetical protein
MHNGKYGGVGVDGGMTGEVNKVRRGQNFTIEEDK